MRDHHVEARQHRVPRRDAMELAVADIADEHRAVGVAHVDAGGVEPDADIGVRTVEPGVVERRQHDVVHGVAGRDAGNEAAHHQPRQRRVAVGEMIDVGLAAAARSAGGRQIEPAEAGIALVAHVGGRHRVAAEAEEAERAALEAVRDLLVAAADLDQVIAIARALEQLQLLVDGSSGERIARRRIEREELRLARLGDRQARDELGERLGVGEPAADVVAGMTSESPVTRMSRPNASRAKNTPRDRPSDE